MLNLVKGLVVGGALVAPMAGHALVKPQINPLSHPTTLLLLVGYNDLVEKDQRRLDFYADRIVSDLVEWVAANESGDAEAARQHGINIVDLSTRLIDAGIKFGLTELEIDDVFRQRFALGFSGEVPELLIVDFGIVGVRDLLTLELAAPAPGINSPGENDYVDSVRSAGESLFND